MPAGAAPDEVVFEEAGRRPRTCDRRPTSTGARTTAGARGRAGPAGPRRRGACGWLTRRRGCRVGAARDGRGRRSAAWRISRLLTGASRFVDDVAPAGLLHAAFARSPFAAARIGSVDDGAARMVPGVVECGTPRTSSCRAWCPILERGTSWSRRCSCSPATSCGSRANPWAMVLAGSRYAAEDGAGRRGRVHPR